MPRKEPKLEERDRGRASFVVHTWKGDELPQREFAEKYRRDDYHENEPSSRHRRGEDYREREPPIRYRREDEYPERVSKSRKETQGDEREYGGKKRFPKENALRGKLEEDEDANDYETYAYEYKAQTYLRSPRSSGDVRAREERRDTRRSPPSYKRSPDQSPRRLSNGKERKKEERYTPKHSRIPPLPRRDLHSRDEAVLNNAATKIQAAFRGYQSRKKFWRQMEHHRRQEYLTQSSTYKADEYSIPSATSIVDDASVSALATNTDPNLGLTAPLPTIDSSQKHHIIRDMKSKLTFSEEIPTVNQLQTETSPTLILCGGINPPQSKDYILGGAMFVYVVQKDKWFYGGAMPEPRNYHGAVYLNGKIYIIGGYSPLQITRGQMTATQSTFQLTVRSKRWRRRADMHQPRACHGTCIVGDNIMVMGGRDATGKLLSTVELYFSKRDQWTLVKSMPESVMGMACTVLDGCVWVIGGIINEGHSSRFTVSNRVYAFDLEKQTWYRQASLPEPRAFSCAATLKREIWLWCGVKDTLNEDGFLFSTNTVFVYNPDVTKWEQHSTIGTSKHAVALAKFGRRVYLLGGMSNVPGSKEVLNENDYYNREIDKYMEGASLPRPLAGSAAVALPIDYVASSDPKWNAITSDDMDEAATKIQAVYRGYRTRSLISNSKFPIYSSHSDTMQKSSIINTYAQQTTTESHGDKWRLFQRVQIDDWPPIADPQLSTSEVNVKYGAVPRGYTVTSTNSRLTVRRYVPLPPHADPNLSIFGHICNRFKAAKKSIGLRKVENLPSFVANLTTVSTLQDDSLPVILAIGGLQLRDPVNVTYGKLILRYHLLKDRWEYFGALPEPRNYHAAVYYQEFIYVTGGCDPDKINSGEMVSTNTTYSLNIHSSEWVEKAEMHCCRSHHSLVLAGGRLYAIGGRDHNGRLIASIECYDIEHDKWSLLRPMPNPRMGMACAVFDNHIWCMGGIGLTENSEAMSYPVLSSVISYDIAKDGWISRPPLRCPRVYASCVIVNDAMWLCGGASKDRASNCLISIGSVDKYYPTEAQWLRKTIMNNPRHCAAVVPVESCIYIFGGVSSQEWSALSKSEMISVYDISLHTCCELPAPLTGIAAVAVPPPMPSLRSESLALLLHTKLTFH